MSAPAENQINGTTVYYAVGVYPETRGGATKGIPVFEAPRKNVVAIFYHELNEETPYANRSKRPRYDQAV
jgi:hypothetical protein